jgi:signal transduction histidine kinase
VLSFAGLSMLALRRRAPLPGIVVMASALAAQVLLVEPVAFFFGGYVPLALMTYAVGAHAPKTSAAVAGLAAALCGLAVVTSAVPALHALGDRLFDGVILVTVWTVGYIVGARGRRADELGRRADQLEREREHVIGNERARLARELHDIVAHSVSVIAVQAQAGEALMDEPERAAAAFRSIQTTSHQALVELRRLLGLLRDVQGPADRAPQPGLSQVEELVEQMRAAGLTIDLSVHGSPRRVDPGVDLSAYRVIQEALTNALRHAGPARARVEIRYLPYAVEVEVVDDGRGAAAAAAAAQGHGLVGMRERVTLYGGEVSAGSSPGGGFAVRARLPLEPA